MVKNLSGGKISSYEDVRELIASVLESKKVEEEIKKLSIKKKKNLL